MFYVRGLNGHFTRTPWKTAIAMWLLCACLGARASERAQRFDLPAQPLEQAVERFSVASGWSVMYAADLAAGRSSHPVHGQLPPLQALRELLRGTGVDVEMAGPQRAVLRPGVAADLPADSDGTPRDPAQRQRRYGLLQQRLRALLCSEPLLVPGGYAATLAFALDAQGQVRAPELRVGSGNAGRDARLLAALGELQLPTELASLPQPVVLQLRPDGARRECAAGPNRP